MTFNGTAGSTYYYNTSGFNPGDVQRIALQADATGLSTGRYGYSIAIGDVRAATTTTTVTGSATVINHAASAFGAGWTLAGLERVVPATGGAVLDLGSGANSLWFAAGSGATYVTPKEDFSTLVANSDGTYTRTMTDGTAINFDTSGREVAAVDLHGVAITYGYDGSGRLSTIGDIYGNSTTFAYDATSGLLATITDPASRVASFAHSGTKLSGVTLPDAATWGYQYDTAGKLTQITDPNSRATAIAYDAAGRVNTVTHPDTGVDTIIAAQTRGFVPVGSGTASNPAVATLLAEARSTTTDPLGNESEAWPDWIGFGLTNVAVDPLGNVASAVRDANGQNTVMVDPLNRITQSTYDAWGNTTGMVYPDGATTSATFNAMARPLTVTDELNRTTTYQYNTTLDRTMTTQPLGIYQTNTYTGDGQRASDSNPTGFHVGSPFGSANPGGGTITYAHDAQDRLTGQTDALGDATTYGYDLAGNRTSVTDANNHATTTTYDALGARADDDRCVEPHDDDRLRRGRQPHQRHRPARPRHDVYV